MLNITNVYLHRYVLIIIMILFSFLTTDKQSMGNEGNIIHMKYQKAILANGLSIILVEHHELPVVAIDLLVKAGSVNDPQEKQGLANMVAQLLREGTCSKNSLEISEEIDFIGGTLSAYCEYDSTSITATSLVKHFKTILDLLSEVARFPTFKLKDIEFQRDKAITSILREKDNKSEIAGRHFSEMLYGIHPYAHPSIGTLEGLKTVTDKEIIEFHKKHYLPNNSILTVVGDIDPAGVLDVIKKTFGDWKKADIQKPALPSIPKTVGHRIRLVDKPDLTQTEISIGHPGIKRTDRDYFPILLLNHILGVGPVSRLYTELRVERGLTYGARSNFDARKLQGPFYINTYSKNETAIETLRLILDELQKLKYSGITKEELDSAKSYYVGHFPLSIETPAQIASKIIEQEFYGLPEDYLEKYLENIKAVSREDVNRAIERFVDPDNLVIVLVSRVEDILKEAKTLGEVELRKP